MLLILGVNDIYIFFLIYIKHKYMNYIVACNVKKDCFLFLKLKFFSILIYLKLIQVLLVDCRTY